MERVLSIHWVASVFLYFGFSPVPSSEVWPFRTESPLLVQLQISPYVCTQR